MIFGQIIFGSQSISFQPRAEINGEAREIGLGVWKTLGLEILLEPLDLPKPCFDMNELRRRNDSVWQTKERGEL